jgi:hypothetical protein
MRARMTLSGNSTYNVPRTRSAQKFLRRPADRRTIPRTSATATAIPTAAETKLWNASWVIWERCDMVVSPEYDCQLVLVVKDAAVSNACRSTTPGNLWGLRGKRCCTRSTR